MARFMAWIEGNRGPASRLGSKPSGIQARVNGWNIGVKVYGRVDADGNDVFDVYETAGSNGGAPERLITTVKEGD